MRVLSASVSWPQALNPGHAVVGECSRSLFWGDSPKLYGVLEGSVAP